MVGDAHYGQMQIDQNEIRRDFMKLREHIASAGINYSCTLREGSSFAPELKVGLYGEYRTRDYRTGPISIASTRTTCLRTSLTAM